jgi:hypothetical protein
MMLVESRNYSLVAKSKDLHVNKCADGLIMDVHSVNATFVLLENYVRLTDRPLLR